MGNKEKQKKKGGLLAHYIELESPLDFARHNFSYGSRHIKALKEGNKFRFLSNGEKLGEVRMIYYADFESSGNFFVYHPGSETSERYEIKDKVVVESADYRSYTVPIIQLLSNPYTEVKDFKGTGEVQSVKVKDYGHIVRSLISRMNEDEMMPKLYSFFSNNSHIIGTFELFHESGAKIFTYADIDNKQRFSALRYNYTNDTIEPANSFDDRSAIYIRVINLSRPFPFF